MDEGICQTDIWEAYNHLIIDLQYANEIKSPTFKERLRDEPGVQSCKSHQRQTTQFLWLVVKDIV